MCGGVAETVVVGVGVIRVCSLGEMLAAGTRFEKEHLPGAWPTVFSLGKESQIRGNILGLGGGSCSSHDVSAQTDLPLAPLS